MTATVDVREGDCLTILPTLADGSVAAIVTDPPAGISFMGRAWDGDRGGRDQWIAWMQQVAAECLRVAKPGAHALVWALPRTSHWTAMAWENAGWDARDRLAYLFGAGFPKSRDAERAIDMETCVLPGRHFMNRLPTEDKRKPDDHLCPSTAAGDPWGGWGTALKPACEDWWLLRKPLGGTVGANVLRHGTGALNIDASRVALNGDYKCKANGRPSQTGLGDNYDPTKANQADTVGRWPANLLHSGDAEVEAAFAAFGEKNGGHHPKAGGAFGKNGIYGTADGYTQDERHSDTGNASRFFKACPMSQDELRFHYSGKADKDDRAGSKHPTVKPISLMRWLVRLITPPGGTMLDCFAGSGTTGEAAMLEGFDCILIEHDKASVADIKRRMGRASGDDTPLFAERGTSGAS